MKQIKSIYLRNIYEVILKRKKMLFFLVVVFTVFFGVFGYKKGISGQQLSKDQEQKIKDYESNIAAYDNTLSEIDNSIELAQKQIDQLQEYIDHSIFMSLDSQNIHVSSAQFAISNNDNTANILSLFTYFINEGGLLKELSNDYKDIDTKYFKEIISCSTGSNVLNVTVYHNEKDKAEKLLDSIETCINRQAIQISKTQGTFTIQKINSSSFIKADVNVADNQNNNINNIKNYLNNKVDLENKRISQESNKSLYIENNESKILAIGQVNPFKEGIKFAVLGAVFGVLILWCYYSIKFILGDDLKSKADLSNANMPVIGSYNTQMGYVPIIDKVLMDVQIWSEQYQISKIFFNALSDSELVKKIVNDYSEKIKQSGLTVITEYHVNDDIEALRKMVLVKYSIVIVQVGKTTYSKINEQIALCEKFGIKILGYIVVE